VSVVLVSKTDWLQLVPCRTIGFPPGVNLMPPVWAGALPCGFRDNHRFRPGSAAAASMHCGSCVPFGIPRGRPPTAALIPELAERARWTIELSHGSCSRSRCKIRVCWPDGPGCIASMWWAWSRAGREGVSPWRRSQVGAVVYRRVPLENVLPSANSTGSPVGVPKKVPEMPVMNTRTSRGRRRVLGRPSSISRAAGVYPSEREYPE
jgi:hypothetical protein